MSYFKVRTAVFIMALVLAGVASAGGNVWVTDSGERHSVGHNAVFIGEDGESFDLADLTEGESREFGPAARPLVATRVGDEVRLERDATDEDRALSMTCDLRTDNCKVVASGDDDDRVMVIINKQGDGHFDQDMIALGHAGANVMVERIADCDDGEDCVATIHVKTSGSAHDHGELIEIVALDDDDSAGRLHVVSEGLHVHGDHAQSGATKHDLSELYDGETRIFGDGDKQVTVVRDGDEITIAREDGEDAGEMTVSCTVGRDTCRVMTFDDDPSKVMVMIEKSRSCVNGEGDCGLVHVGIDDGSADVRVIELKDGGVFVAKPGDSGTVSSGRRVIIIDDDDD